MVECKEPESQTKEVSQEEKIEEPRKMRWNVANAIEVVSSALKDSGYNVKKTQKYTQALSHLTEYFQSSEGEAQLLCMVIWHFFGSNGSSYALQYIASDINCNPMKIIAWNGYVISLIERGYLVYVDDWLTNYNNLDFNVSLDVLEGVIKNCEIRIGRNSETLDYVGFVSNVADRYEKRRRNERSSYSLHSELNCYESKHCDIPFVKKTMELINDSWARFMFYDICNDFIQGGKSNLNATVFDLYDSAMRFKIANELMNETHILFKKSLIEFDKKGNMNDASLTLSQKGKELLFGEEVSLYDQRIDEKLLVKPENIKEKHLFYSPENQKSIDNLKNALTDETLQKIQERLKEENMPVGVAVLLYGGPGTGKTETVYQIARETGRPIVHVDISDTKSCWFGESEKIIKNVFKSYHNMCDAVIRQGNGKMPILLFNEADAVFGKRKNTETSNVAQTENAIQNIILEEMENLKGIMIATTNLTENLDAAFERRFLFKLHFENPSVESKKAIWMDKLPWIEESTAEKFATNFDFSGGEIENVVRKATMNEVITGKRASMEELEEMCRVEKLETKSSRRVGFEL